MGDWQRSREFSGKKSTPKQRFRKPPTGSWKTSVSSWEKEFCSIVCLIPWWKVCETKKIMSLYEKVVQWNDSAGEEAFSNAKKRFWAQINGLQCDVSLSDPDIYIDQVDWNLIDDIDVVDPELLLALDQEAAVVEKTKDDADNSRKLGLSGNNWDNFGVFSSNQGNNPFPCSRWDDGDDQVRAVNDSAVELGWWKGDAENNERSWKVQDSWDNQAGDRGNVGITSSGWGDGDHQVRAVNDAAAELSWWKGDVENNERSWKVHNSWDNREFHPGERGNALVTSSRWDDAGVQDWPINDRTAEYGWGNNYGSSWKCHDWDHGFTELSGYEPAGQGKRNWAPSNGSGRKREGDGRYGTRYNKTTRYQSGPGKASPMNGGWWNCSGSKRADHSTHERAPLGK